MVENRRQSDNELSWLVKVEGEILGPHSFNEVLLKLTAGEFLPQHEVISPLDRWCTIQTQPLFAAAVEKIKQQGHQTGDVTLTKSSTMTSKTSFTRTMELKVDGSTPTPIMIPTTTEAENTKAPEVPAAMTSASPAYEVKAPKTNNSVMLLIMLGGVLAVIGAMYTLMSNPKSKMVAPVDKDAFLSHMDQALKLRKKGYWSEALSEFKQAYQLKSRDAGLIFEMSPLMLQLDNQSIATRSNLEKIMKRQYRSEDLEVGNTLLGLTHSYEGHYKEAIEHYDKALAASPNYAPALLNKGYNLGLLGKYKKGQEVIAQAINASGKKESIYYLYLIRTYLREGLQTGDKESYDKARLLAKRVSSNFYDGRQEALMFQAFAENKLGTKARTVNQLIEKALEVDPDLTSMHKHPLLVDWRGLKWKSFAYVCNGLERVVNKDLSGLFKFVCAYQLNNDGESRQIVDIWMRKQPQSPWPHLANAILKQKIRAAKDSLGSLDFAKSLGAKGALYLQIRTRACVSLKDIDCLKQMASSLSRVSPLYSSYARFASGNGSVSAGLQESHNFLPLIQQQSL